MKLGKDERDQNNLFSMARPGDTHTLFQTGASCHTCFWKVRVFLRVGLVLKLV